MKNLRANPRPWITGTVIAFLGVALARVVAPHVGGAWRFGFTLSGELVALTGLLVIGLGIRRRLREGAANGGPPGVSPS
jgi:hypothetical protein